MEIRKNSLIKIAAISFLLTIFWSASAYAQIIFQDDFESGDFLKWDFVWRDGQNPAESAEYGLDGQAVTNGGVTIGNITPSTLRHAGNHAYQDHYAMNASGAAHNDNNHMLLKRFNSPTHWFMRAYLYFANDIKWCGATNPGSAGLQRKLIYFKGTNWDTDSSVFGFALGTWSNSGCDGVTLRLGYGGHGGMGGALDNIALLQSGRWYSIEVEVNLATTLGNDTFRLWLDDVLIMERSDLSIQSQSDINGGIGLGQIELGRQVDRYNSNAFDEYRYWDDITVSTTRIGPIDGSGGDTGGNTGNSGGDTSSSSGGSGCGFVKDDGKGLKAKGEGLSFMLMLIIALAGIAIVRKIAINKGSKGIEHIKRMICLMPYSKCIWLLIMVITSTSLVNTSHAAVLVDENFDDSNYADTGWTAWLQNGNCNTGTTMAISSNAAYRGSAGLDIYYHMGDNPRGDCQLHQDNNTSLVHTFSPGLNHYFVRGYFRFPFNTTTLCSMPVIQRKLIYFKPQNYNSNGWNFIVNAWPWINCSTDGYNVSVTFRGPTGSDTLWGNGSPGFFPTNNHLYVNTWYYIEAEVEYGAYGQDTMRIWLAPAGTSPSLIFERTDLTFRSEQDVAGGITLGTMEIGRQVDIVRDSFSQGIDEHRYWDEIVISTTPIGPVDGGSGGNTPPPSSSSSGGDSGGGSSGGGGCGFVKDDGKGQKAKDEGVLFAMMLIIALAGIALRRIIAKLKMRRAFSALIKGLSFFVVAVLLAQIAACGSGGGGDSSNFSNNSSGGSGGDTGGDTGSAG